MAPQIETLICTRRSTIHQFMWWQQQQQQKCVLWADHRWCAEWLENTTILCTSSCHPRHRHPPCENDSAKNSGIYLTASAPVLDVCVPAYVNRIWPLSAACECGAVERIIEHAILHCPIHRPPHGLHGLKVLEDNRMAGQHLPRDLVPPSSG